MSAKFSRKIGATPYSDDDETALRSCLTSDKKPVILAAFLKKLRPWRAMACPVELADFSPTKATRSSLSGLNGSVFEELSLAKCARWMATSC